MKQLKTNNMQIIKAGLENIDFRLSSELIASQTTKLEWSYCILVCKL